VNTSKRLQYICANPQMYEEVRQAVKAGVHAGGPCPCPDCDGKLTTKTVTWTDPRPDGWVQCKRDLLACKTCGFQVHINKEGEP